MRSGENSRGRRRASRLSCTLLASSLLLGGCGASTTDELTVPGRAAADFGREVMLSDVPTVPAGIVKILVPIVGSSESNRQSDLHTKLKLYYTKDGTDIADHRTRAEAACGIAAANSALTVEMIRLYRAGAQLISVQDKVEAVPSGTPNGTPSPGLTNRYGNSADGLFDNATDACSKQTDVVVSDVNYKDKPVAQVYFLAPAGLGSAFLLNQLGIIVPTESSSTTPSAMPSVVSLQLVGSSRLPGAA